MKVLLGIGGGNNPIAALQRTVERAQAAGDTLTVALLECVLDRPVEEIESRVRSTLDEAGFEADIERLNGEPGSELIRTAEQEDFDTIVIGADDQTPMRKIRLGDLAQYVILNSPVTVTLVR